MKFFFGEKKCITPLMEQKMKNTKAIFLNPDGTLQQAVQLCKAMLQQGVIRESSSAFNLPIVMVKKKDGSTGFCIDFSVASILTVD